MKLFAELTPGHLVPVELSRGQLAPVELANERDPILKKVDRYLDEYEGQRRANYTRTAFCGGSANSKRLAR
jgi:hypothetical protein